MTGGRNHRKKGEANSKQKIVNPVLPVEAERKTHSPAGGKRVQFPAKEIDLPIKLPPRKGTQTLGELSSKNGPLTN